MNAARKPGGNARRDWIRMIVARVGSACPTSSRSFLTVTSSLAG